MPPEQIQQNMTPEEAKAGLGLSTRLVEEFLLSQAQQQPQEGDIEAEMPQDEELELETEETPPLDEEALKSEIKDDLIKEVKKEFKDVVKVELKKLFDEDDEDEQDEATKDSE